MISTLKGIWVPTDEGDGTIQSIYDKRQINKWQKKSTSVLRNMVVKRLSVENNPHHAKVAAVVGLILSLAAGPICYA